MIKNLIGMDKYMLTGWFACIVPKSKERKFCNELSALLIKYSKDQHFFATEGFVINAELNKKITEEVNKNENNGLVTCPYTSEWCDHLKDKDITLFLHPTKLN